jgi:hypothetical protein
MGIDITNASLRFLFNPCAMKIHNYSDAHCHLHEGSKKELEVLIIQATSRLSYNCFYLPVVPVRDIQLCWSIWKHMDAGSRKSINMLSRQSERFAPITTTLLFALIFGSLEYLHCFLHFLEGQHSKAVRSFSLIHTRGSVLRFMWCNSKSG